MTKGRGREVRRESQEKQRSPHLELSESQHPRYTDTVLILLYLENRKRSLYPFAEFEGRGEVMR